MSLDFNTAPRQDQITADHLVPNRDMMLDHLMCLFGDQVEGLVELAWTPANSSQLTSANLFKLDQLEDLAERATALNATQGVNVYIGAVLRHPETALLGRTGDDDAFLSTAYWADLDEPGCAEAAEARCGSAVPNLAVVTGRHPHLRQQLYWLHEEPVGLATLQGQNAAIASKLQSDPAVTNTGRVMRLAGSIAWPKKIGRVAELTELIAYDKPPYINGAVANAFPIAPNDSTPDRPDQDFNKADRQPRELKELADMLASARPGRWHDTMRNVVASLVGKDYSDNQIRLICAAKCDDGFNDPDLDKLIHTARNKFGKQDAQVPAPLVTPKIISPTDWYGATVPERKWVVDKLIPHGNVTMLSGDGGLGKSQLALQLLINASVSRHWLGCPTLACKALGVFCEDDEDELHRRTFWTCQDLGIELCDLQNLALINQVGLDSVMVEFDAQEQAQPTAFFNQVLEQAQDFSARLVVLDSLHDIFAGNENSRPQARHFVNALRRIAIAIDGAVLITSHPSLTGRNTGSGEAGSTAWHNAVRSRLYLTAPSQQDGEDIDPNRRILTNKKANYGPSGEVIECEWRNGVFVPIGQGLSKSIRENQAEETFLECLDLLATRGTSVSEAPTSANYAPKKVARMKESGKCSKRDLERAMERLFSTGTITNELVGAPSRRQSTIVRVESEKP